MPQQYPVWPNGCRAAVSLTYDDGIPAHTQFVAPQLEEYGLRGTFYTPLKSDLIIHPLAWRALAERGHEIGNHTIFHPCRDLDGRYNSWLPQAFNLAHYDEKRWQEEIRVANGVLRMIDGKDARTFGNTCFDNWLGPEEAPVRLDTLAAEHFAAARGEETNRPVDLQNLNRYNLGTVWADRRTFAAFREEFEALLNNGGWIIYTFHGVGEGTHNHFIAEKEHQQLLAFLRDQQAQIWTAPVVDVVKCLFKE